METIHRLQLPFKLDQLTEGLGNCFPIAIIQQLQRPEILSQLRPAPRRLVRNQTGHSLLRRSVHQFIVKSKSPRVAMLKTQYEETDGIINGETWNKYWDRMIADKTWVDYWFVQATAWYLQLDMWIVATSSTEANPYIEVSGNLADAGIPSSGPVVTLGTKSNCHYQSLLPIEMFHLEFHQNQQHSSNRVHQAKQVAKSNDNTKKGHYQGGDKLPKCELEDIAHNIQDKKTEDNKEAETTDSPKYHPFIYESNEKLLVFLCKTDEYMMKCPM
jgi:hypothetical protein